MARIKERGHSCPRQKDDKVIAHDDTINMLPRLTRKSAEYIESRAGKKEPFFLHVPLGSPHTPIVPSKAWQGKSPLGPYGDFVMESDNVVGEISKALEKHGLTNNTLLIFTSDNGCPKAADPSETRNLYPTDPERSKLLLAALEKDVTSGRSTKGPASENDAPIVLWKESQSKDAGGKRKKRKAGDK